MSRHDPPGSPDPAAPRPSRRPRPGGDDALDIAARKRRLTLDLPQLIPIPNMRTPGLSPGGSAPLLSSPDVRKLQISSPELERLIIQNWMQKSPGAAGGATPVSVAEEQQQMYAKGFVDAINSVQSGFVNVLAGGPPSPYTAYGFPLPVPLAAPFLMHIPSSPVPAHSQSENNNKAHHGPNQSNILPAHLTTGLGGLKHGSSLPVPLLPQIVLSPISPTSIIPPTSAAGPLTILAPAASRGRRRPTKSSEPPPPPAPAEALPYSPSASLSPSVSEGQRVPSRPASSSSLHHPGRRRHDSEDSEELDMETTEEPMQVDNMDSDEERMHRRARKRERNRLAAARCRQRKLERIDELSGQANKVRDDNEALEKEADNLRRQIAAMKKQVALHVQNGCHFDMSESLRRSVDSLLAESARAEK
ncbi:transcription factor JunD-like [Paramacrobiotus metropolitanus]|uniref:transcription factor JunD-like n=1 Tax=Paramacrobiotus metropolitanus TaxID=2943436 RepID=UPI00244571B4|nr:transcription factor JunD-like [Paramacrobiotus metropolitanus]